MNPSAVTPVCLTVSSGLRRRSQRFLYSIRPAAAGQRQQRHDRTTPQHHQRPSTAAPHLNGVNSTVPSRVGGPQREMSSAPELTHQRIKGRSRFYKTVTIREIVADKAGDEASAAAAVGDKSPRWEILLDSRVLKTPGRRPLQFDSPELAMAVAAEWDAQDTSKGIEPAVMPLMALASTALDQVASDREKTVATCLKYLPTDTVCFLSPDPDPVIARRQRQLWSPLRDWTEEALGIPVATTTEIHRTPQHPPEALARARDLLESLDEWGLAAVQSATMECKSLVIALALLFRKTTVEKAFDAARLEEEYNVERWGMIEGGHDMDRANTTLTLTAASTLIWLRSASLRPPSP
ncbi:similar to ATP synthase mitochondrial F1 complex assembly factor 2 [Ectocarpus siliculosus]|uniref:Similar to ATP synthase mitochondrial F1 complex assembly factor 2 n=1 Tax=Ectocarpus siliculosus TaxID=2880 RepID=D7FMM9_ECTSI|nr:similar to ATP synthase mitochondrial F1 complex assembly factor 2 [Ectocarpus siliculosus]|eukprot:CBJ25926.1 similar to ATP synthase mitochondrial F1 complex assembly factor 2 [Ectocarpus siliculosus]